MTLDAALGALEQVPAIAALRTSTLAYPLVNALHVIGLALLFGAIVTLDLRLLGFRRGAASVDSLAALVLPVAIAGLVLAMVAGALMFATDARAYAGSTLFRAKMLLLATAIANAAALHRVDWRTPRDRSPRIALAAASSIALWLAVIVLGRLIGYS